MDNTTVTDLLHRQIRSFVYEGNLYTQPISTTIPRIYLVDKLEAYNPFSQNLPDIDREAPCSIDLFEMWKHNYVQCTYSSINTKT